MFCVLFFLLLNNDALNSEKGCFVVQQVVRVYQRYNEKRSWWLWVFSSDVTLRARPLRWVLGFRLLYLLGVGLILDPLGFGSCFLRAICCLLSWLVGSIAQLGFGRDLGHCFKREY